VGIADVALLAEHGAFGAELLTKKPAAFTRAAVDEVMERDAIPFPHARDPLPDVRDDPCDFMSEGDRELGLSASGAVMRVGVTDAGTMDIDNDLTRAGEGIGCIGELERLAGLDETDRVHPRMVLRLASHAGRL
jgi:hypothetical protein